MVAVNGLGAGTYSVTVTDANGCSTTTSITLTEPALLVSGATSPTFIGGNNISCNGLADGSIDLTVTGGNTAYAFSWTGPNSFTANTEDLNGLGAGTYSVTVTDANGCSTTTSITLTEPALLVSGATSPTFIGGNNISCNGLADGSIDLTVTGGNTAYAFSWTGPNSFTANTEDLNGPRCRKPTA